MKAHVSISHTMLLFMLLTACAGSSMATDGEVPLPDELSVAEYPLKQAPEMESDLLYFADSVEQDPRLAHSGAKTFDWDAWTCPPGEADFVMGMCVVLGPDTLAAQEQYDNLGNGQVIVMRNGEEIYKIPVGKGSPINGLRGIWTYDEHWALETALVNLEEGADFVTGQVSVDGSLINEQYGYDEAFGFQTINGEPFYFYRQEGKIQANYAGADIQLDYDEIPHYGCCSASSLNPRMYQDMVTFYARRGETWYYGEIGVFGQP